MNGFDNKKFRYFGRVSLASRYEIQKDRITNPKRNVEYNNWMSHAQDMQPNKRLSIYDCNIKRNGQAVLKR